MAKYHKITGNESVGTIAGMYGVTPQTLLAANPGVSTLAAGAYIRVPGLSTTSSMGGLGTNLKNVLSGQYQSNYQTATGQTAAAPGSLAGVPLAVPQYQENLNAPGRTQKLRSKVPAQGTMGGIVYDEANPRPATQTQTPTPQPRRGTYGQTLPVAPPAYGSDSPEGMANPTGTPRPNMNAQQIAELNLANARNTFKPSSQLLNWNQQVSSGITTPLTSSMFNELTTLSVNNGLPRDAAILAVNSMLQAKGYTYNPVTKGYVATNQSAPATQKDIAGNPVTTDGGKFSADSWENYKQKTIARGGKRTWIRGGNRGSEPTATAPAATGSNVPNSTGSADSIWRIG
mgnify:CR=1 FL=1